MSLNFMGKSYIDLVDCCAVLKLDIQRVRNSMQLGNTCDKALRDEINRINRCNEIVLQKRKMQLGIKRELKLSTCTFNRTSHYEIVCAYDEILDKLGYLVVLNGKNKYVASKEEIKNIMNEFSNITISNATTIATRAVILDEKCTYEKLNNIHDNNLELSWKQVYGTYINNSTVLAKAV